MNGPMEMNEQMGKVTDLTSKGWQLVLDYGPTLIMALVVLWAGHLLIKLFARLLDRAMQRREVEPTLHRFLRSLVTIALRVLLFITVIQMLGVETTSFVAIIGAAGLAIGLALQGTLANFAGGTLILLFRPYKVGDLIEAQGVTGHVKEIQIFTTILLTPENKTAIIPNGPMANGNIINYSADGRMRVDLTFGIGHDMSIVQTREVLTNAMRNHPNVRADPAPGVTIAKINQDGVELAVRPWCHPDHYWDVYFGVYEAGREALRTAGIRGPQREMFLHNQH